MKIEGACGSHAGKARTWNSDNLLFDHRCIPQDNTGLKYPVSAGMTLMRPVCCGVFDGMASDAAGARRAHLAAATLKEAALELNEYIIHGKHFLQNACTRIHQAVSEITPPGTGQEPAVSSIMALFSPEYLYICSTGSCRAYRLRGGEFMQLTDDPRYPEPYIAKGKPLPGDWYLLCSDGLSDVLTNFEISCPVFSAQTPADCVNLLIRQAIQKGGQDSISIIACRIVA